VLEGSGPTIPRQERSSSADGRSPAVAAVNRSCGHDVALLANGVSLEMLSGERGFAGVGAVAASGIAIRSARRPLFVQIRTPDGVLVTHYELLEQSIEPEKVSIDLELHGQADGQMEYMLHEVRPRYNTADWTAPPRALDARLRLEIVPVERLIGGREFTGLRYQYDYRSERHPVYRILDRGTWEPGARALGNEFWMRSCFAPGRITFDSIEQHYSTEWHLPTAANPNIFQFLPLQTELQGFTFTSSAAGTLVTWSPQVRHIRSLFEKPRGSDEIVHWHEHCGDLSAEFHSAPIEVLFTPGQLNRVERANLYEALREIVHETLHAQIGMRRERVTTYGQIEEWTLPDIGYYRREGVPKLREAGVKTIYLANHFQNNMNVWGVSNMCCTVDLKVADSVGEDDLRGLCQDIHDGGARTEMWGNTSISTLTLKFHSRNGSSATAEGSPDNGDAGRIRFLPRAGSIMDVFSRAEEPWVRNASGAIEADHYTPSFAVMNLRDPVVAQYWLSCWKDARDHVGIDGIFLDSSFNLSSDKFHYVQNARPISHDNPTPDQVELLGSTRPANAPPAAILTQYHAHLNLMVEMQKLGYHYCNEDLGVFGIHRHGPGIAMRLDSLPIWSDCIANFDPEEIRRAGADLEEVFFRALAYRMMWAIHWNIKRNCLSFSYHNGDGPECLVTPWHLGLLGVYNEVEQAMVRREILPEEVGVIYASRDGRERVVWAFSPFDLPLRDGEQAADLSTGTRLARSASIRVEKHHVYRLTD
jgi:hypothetical protein